ncbi:Alpha/Beta hydrolase protein [Aspergillus pseudoustus]|uniref:Alpha/Beta hydrolase protein n=1 Tax=Aspergillus pseudoustus TaxID=1810923 RepID=A0ABR4IIQ0_9EURO
MASIKPSQTIVYKTVGDLDIPMDVYLPPNAHSAPILLWFHGGGLLQARRDMISPHMRAGVSKYNYIAISADYRLAPQVKVGEIFEDVKDCIAFIRTKLQMILGDAADVSRLAVSGSSAGGFLALLAGLYVDPKPQVIVPIYPITDPLGSFFTTPQPRIEGIHYASTEDLAPYLDPNAPVVSSSGYPPDDPRGFMYWYMLRTATLPQLLGLSADDPTAANPYRISRNIAEHGLPPAYIIHGDADTAVGVEQADEVVGAVAGRGLTVEYERVPGKDHLFDNEEGYENDRMYEFVMKYL